MQKVQNHIIIETEASFLYGRGRRNHNFSRKDCTIALFKSYWGSLFHYFQSSLKSGCMKSNHRKATHLAGAEGGQKHSQAKTETLPRTTPQPPLRGFPYMPPGHTTSWFYDVRTQCSAILYAKDVPLFTQHSHEHTTREWLPRAQLCPKGQKGKHKSGVMNAYCSWWNVESLSSTGEIWKAELSVMMLRP